MRRLLDFSQPLQHEGIYDWHILQNRIHCRDLSAHKLWLFSNICQPLKSWALKHFLSSFHIYIIISQPFYILAEFAPHTKWSSCIFLCDFLSQRFFACNLQVDFYFQALVVEILSRGREGPFFQWQYKRSKKQEISNMLAVIFPCHFSIIFVSQCNENPCKSISLKKAATSACYNQTITVQKGAWLKLVGKRNFQNVHCCNIFQVQFSNL